MTGHEAHNPRRLPGRRTWVVALLLASVTLLALAFIPEPAAASLYLRAAAFAMVLAALFIEVVGIRGTTRSPNREVQGPGRSER